MTQKERGDRVSTVRKFFSFFSLFLYFLIFNLNSFFFFFWNQYQRRVELLPNLSLSHLFVSLLLHPFASCNRMEAHFGLNNP